MGVCSSKSGAAGASAGGPAGDYGGGGGNNKAGGCTDLSPASSKGAGGGDLRYNMLKASKGDRFHETYEVHEQQGRMGSLSLSWQACCSSTATAVSIFV